MRSSDFPVGVNLLPIPDCMYISGFPVGLNLLTTPDCMRSSCFPVGQNSLPTPDCMHTSGSKVGLKTLPIPDCMRISGSKVGLKLFPIILFYHNFSNLLSLSHDRIGHATIGMADSPYRNRICLNIFRQRHSTIS